MSIVPRDRCVAVLMMAVVMAAALVAGCAAEPAAAPAPAPAAEQPVTVVAPPRPVSGRRVPALEGDPVLTLTGRIGSTNAARTLQLDAAALDRLGVLKVGVYEPWVKQNLVFQGVWLADVLAAARADQGARGLHVTALDDYQIDLTTAEVAARGVFLATKRGDGTAIPIEEGGPTRIVYTGTTAAGVSPDLWIWSLTTIDVR
jgi:hypothetical protein